MIKIFSETNTYITNAIGITCKSVMEEVCLYDHPFFLTISYNTIVPSADIELNSDQTINEKSVLQKSVTTYLEGKERFVGQVHL